MRLPALCTTILALVVVSHPLRAVALVDSLRAQQHFKARSPSSFAFCERSHVVAA